MHILDVNVGTPDIDEAELLPRVVCELQSIIELPLQIDTASPVAMERALRRYNGKPLINSVNGKKESMDAIFPLAKKYGGVIIALTLDENGIPTTAEERIEIAKKIIEEAKKYGIDKKDLVFDTLALTVSADKDSAKETLRALRMIRNDLGCHTSLGVSNVSFGLPVRELINGTFFALALSNGLSAAIMNPNSAEMQKTYYTYRALSGLDENFENLIAFSSTYTVTEQSAPQQKDTQKQENGAYSLKKAVEKGLREDAASLAQQLLQTRDPLEIIQNEIIPALNCTGEAFEKKTLFLPQLLMCAEAAKSAFEVIKTAYKGKRTSEHGTLVLATVHGDIHDIGKNIVKLLLENYGYDVVDLGKDVPPSLICDTVVRLHAPLVGLSALMTTTLGAMQETIELLKKNAPFCKIMVGGAVLTPEYAEKLGADGYAKDAMEAVRCADRLSSISR